MRKFSTIVLITLLILSVSAISFAAGSPEKESESVPVVNVMGVWGGTELESFQKVVAASGIEMNFESVKDLDMTLTTRAAAGNPPDIAILPNPAKMVSFAKDGVLVPLTEMFSKDQMAQYKKDYSDSWVELGTVDKELYGLFYKAANKSCIFYSPKQFEANGWEVPGTWDELVTLTKKISDDGKTPWSISGMAGWPVSDIIESIFLRVNGPELYTQWYNHEIPWTHPSVKAAFETFGQITEDKYLWGGRAGTMANDFVPGVVLVFKEDPEAYLYMEGDFVYSVAKGQLPDLEPGVDIDFFAFPEINPKYGVPVVGGGDVVIAFNDKPQTKALLAYLATGKAGAIWAADGGFTSPNKSVDISMYPSEMSKRSASMLVDAASFRFDASDMMPGPVGWDAFCKGICAKYILDPTKLDQYLEEVEKAAQKAY